ncbi:MAG: ABC transporter permease subunit [Hyphomicrobiales bacterium]|nr:ABC transporter permease subunit [Hyphomicrobiales bacterium]MDE2113378.1 ABC transporter permease subunit [Hyphomicrobiales bacterium]
MAPLKPQPLAAWAIFGIAAGFFTIPLIATVIFSLSMKRNGWSFEAYRIVLSDSSFIAAFGYSLAQAIAAVLISTLLIVPAAYWVRLYLPAMKQWVEFITLLPLVIPSIILVFGYLRLYNSASWLPLTSNARSTDALLSFGYVTLAMPYLYRTIDAGLRAMDVRTLTEAAQSLGAGPLNILIRVILPCLRGSILNGAFLTLAIVMGEFTLASLLDRPALGPYLQLIGANRAYEPAALAVIAFSLTWFCMGFFQYFSNWRRGV